jgi:hypothetical protein
VWFYIRKSLVNTVTKGMLPSCYQRKKVAVGNTTTLKNEMEAKEDGNIKQESIGSSKGYC